MGMVSSFTNPSSSGQERGGRPDLWTNLTQVFEVQGRNVLSKEGPLTCGFLNILISSGEE